MKHEETSNNNNNFFTFIFLYKKSLCFVRKHIWKILVYIVTFFTGITVFSRGR